MNATPSPRFWSKEHLELPFVEILRTPVCPTAEVSLSVRGTITQKGFQLLIRLLETQLDCFVEDCEIAAITEETR